VMWIHRHALSGRSQSAEPVRVAVDLRSPVATLAAVLAVAPIVILKDPALPVFALGAAVTALHAARGRTSPGAALRGAAPLATGSLFVTSVALGILARAWTTPGALLDEASIATTAAMSALSSVVLNNLPAAVLFSARPPEHVEGLLVGLAIGPNLAVTGSLSALLWWRTARATDADPSALRFSRQGLLLAPAGILAAVLAAAAS